KVKYVASEQNEEIQRVLREILLESGLRRRVHVSISIPRHSVHVKILRLPSLNPDELRTMVGFQVQKEIPLPAQDVVHDFRIMTQEPQGYTQVMIVVARKRDIDRYIKICKTVGLRVDAVRLNIEAIYQFFLQAFRDNQNERAKCLSLVDVDFSATNIIVIERGNFLYCRSVGQGVGELIERMVGGQLAAVYETWSSELSQGVSDTITIFEKNDSGSRVEKVVLTGWLPRVQLLTQQLENHLKLPVSWFSSTIPTGHFYKSDTNTSMQHWFSISTLLGMARAQNTHLMDLRPLEERQNQHRHDLLRKVVYTCLLIVYLLALAGGSAKIAINKHRSALAQLQDKISDLRPQVQIVNKWQKVQKELKKQLGASELTSALVAQALEKMPSSVELSSITFSRADRILLRGRAGRLADVFDMPQIFAQQPDLGEAIITSANRRKKRGAKEMIEFEMKINLHPNKELTLK
ncbi:MAG: pilus assembly protein PilM, partial [bacterium]